MDANTTSPNPAVAAWRKLHAAARKDPKKAGVLAVLVVVMGGLWVKAIAPSRPAVAGAALSPATAGRGDAVAATAAGTQPRETSDKSRAGTAARSSWADVRFAPAERNLFRVDYERYERAGKSPDREPATQQSTESTKEQAKSGPTPADLKKERQILAANLQTQASRLRLQTIVTGAEPKALVNGTLVGEGDEIGSFRVTKINARGMVIEREGIKLEVQMKQ